MDAFFASPSALWLGLLIGPLLLLYMLQHKPVRKRVASVVLWTGVAQSQIATSPFQRLRRSLSLLLMLLALFALVLALAGLRIPGGERRGVPVTLVVDVTASMGANERGGSRIDQAKERAAAVIDAAGNSAISAFAWDGNLRALAPADSEPGVARAALNVLQATHHGATDAALVRVLEGLGTARRVVLVSDHIPGSLSGAHFVPCGSPRVNAAVVSASLTEVTFSQVELFFGIELTGSEHPLRTPLVLERIEPDGSSTLVDARDAVLEPGRRGSFTFAGVGPGLYSLRLKVDDGLALDNVGWLRYSALPVQDVVFSGMPPPALAKAVAAIESEMGLVRLVPAGSEDRQRASYVFCDAASSGVEPRLPSAYLAPAAPRDVSYDQPVDVPQAATRPAASFLWRGAGTPDIRIPGVLGIRTSRQLRPVLEAGPGPAICLLPRDNGLQDLLVAFPLDETATGFTGKFSFPIFWANWFDYVRRAREPLPRGPLSTREIVRVDALNGRGEFRYGLTGTSEREAGTPGRALQFDHAGVYVFEGLDDTDLPLLGVSLLDPSESNLSLADAAAWSPESMTAWMQGFEGEGDSRDLKLHPWLALLAACLLLFEWFWFRRKFPTRSQNAAPAPRAQPAKRRNTVRARA
jgi:hypothetical protein